MPTPPIQPDSSVPAIHLLRLLRLFRSAGSALLTQTSLHGQLLLVEWAREKQRLLAMLLVILLGFACLLVIMLLATALVLALCWETDYRIPAVLALIALYGAGLAVAWWRFNKLVLLGDSIFAGTRSELAADMELLRSTL